MEGFQPFMPTDAALTEHGISGRCTSQNVDGRRSTGPWAPQGRQPSCNHAVLGQGQPGGAPLANAKASFNAAGQRGGDAKPKPCRNRVRERRQENQPQGQERHGWRQAARTAAHMRLRRRKGGKRCPWASGSRCHTRLAVRAFGVLLHGREVSPDFRRDATLDQAYRQPDLRGPGRAAQVSARTTRGRIHCLPGPAPPDPRGRVTCGVTSTEYDRHVVSGDVPCCMRHTPLKQTKSPSTCSNVMSRGLLTLSVQREKESTCESGTHAP